MWMSLWGFNYLSITLTKKTVKVNTSILLKWINDCFYSSRWSKLLNYVDLRHHEQINLMPPQFIPSQKISEQFRQEVVSVFLLSVTIWLVEFKFVLFMKLESYDIKLMPCWLLLCSKYSLDNNIILKLHFWKQNFNWRR